jgi:hypothetical protein
MLENIDDGILEQPPEDAGFRTSEDSKKSCRSCLHYEGRYCDLWNAKTKPAMVCDAWDDFSDFKLAMSDMETEIDMESMESEENDTDGLNDRQEAMYEVYEKIAYVFGKWNQSTGADGAHYVEKSPFEGMNCANCVFFRGGRKCEIVDGDIDPGAVCKLWIVPEKLLPNESE